MPSIGYGVYKINDLIQCEQCVIDAIRNGYRMIDTASIYRNELAVGNALKKIDIPREDLFITSKIWVQDVTYSKTRNAFETSLKNLQLDYLDLYLIHQPVNDYYGAWRAMQELYHDGRIRAIGVSNFTSDRLIDLSLFSDFKPMVNQIEIHPFLQQEEALKIMKDNNIATQAWSPFAQGKNNLFQHELLQLIARKYQKSTAQVILRWLNQREIAVIPRSTNEIRMIENLNIFDFTLSQEDIQLISMLDTGATLFENRQSVEYILHKFNYKI